MVRHDGDRYEALDKTEHKTGERVTQLPAALIMPALAYRSSHNIRRLIGAMRLRWAQLQTNHILEGHRY
jgi:hypothetical protein